MKNFWTCLMAVMVILHAGCANGAPVAKAGLIVTVVDETGQPVPNVSVKGGGWIQSRPYAANVNTETDKQGVVKLSVKTSVDVGLRFEKEGYYASRLHYSVGEGGGKIEKGYWQPNPVKKTIVLKRIKDPVPMYVKGVDENPPAYGKPVGYDLMIGDWVAPYGKGVTLPKNSTVEKWSFSL